jgi:hypothetical protein
MKQPANKVLCIQWGGDEIQRTCIFDEDAMEHSDIGLGVTRLSSLKHARKRLDRLSRELDKLIKKESNL